jgi:hypothetical protein
LRPPAGAALLAELTPASARKITPAASVSPDTASSGDQSGSPLKVLSRQPSSHVVIVVMVVVMIVMNVMMMIVMVVMVLLGEC